MVAVDDFGPYEFKENIIKVTCINVSNITVESLNDLKVL